MLRRRALALVLVAPLAALAGAATATVTIDWVPIGNAGNAADAPSTNCFAANCGSVSYDYRISKYEITNAQYAEFLNAVAASDPLYLYWAGMDRGIRRSGSSGSYSYSVTPGSETKPVIGVPFYSALRFANWLNNGQGGADTETGAYTLLGGTQWPSNGLTVTRNPWANTFLPSENEWYKAAYYSPRGVYFDHPAGTDTQTACATPAETPNRANCDWAVRAVTKVGSYAGSASPFGTYDQGGNAFEWNEQIIDSGRGIRGGRFNRDASELAASSPSTARPQTMRKDFGLRVGSLGPGCLNTLDDDGDGLTDLDDPGCVDASDVDEHAPMLACDDGADNDLDGKTDFLAAGGGDPGCDSPTSPRENPQCQDGLDNDNQNGIDFDGGASLDLDDDGFIDAQFNTATPPVGAADPQCVGTPSKNKEKSGGCGLGFELVLIAPVLARLRRRRRS